MTSQLSFPVPNLAKLQKLADVAVHIGLNVQKGQQVVISAPVESIPLVRLITQKAYQAGASLVTTFYIDDATILTRYQHASDDSFDTAADWYYAGLAQAFEKGAARLAILSDDPNLLAGQPIDKVSRADKARSIAAKPAMKFITEAAVNWCIVAYPSMAWAKTMFPDDTPEAAFDKLSEAIFATTRINAADPVAEWQTHNAALHARCQWMNNKNFAALHYTAPGTNLTIGLADGHKWRGGSSPTKNGKIMFNANMPTEEIFTTPHCRNVNGTVSSTKPLSYNGTLLDGIQMTFKDGRAVKAHSAKGNEVLQNILATDEGAARLGEVALVPHSSPISASGLLYYETLFDENAACHIALGECYTECFQNGGQMDEAEISRRGGNHSLIHIDWMIGSGELDIDGLNADGTREPVMRKGEWAFNV